MKSGPRPGLGLRLRCVKTTRNNDFPAQGQARARPQSTAKISGRYPSAASIAGTVRGFVHAARRGACRRPTRGTDTQPSQIQRRSVDDEMTTFASVAVGKEPIVKRGKGKKAKRHGKPRQYDVRSTMDIQTALKSRVWHRSGSIPDFELTSLS